MRRDYSDPLYKKCRAAVLNRDGHKCKWPNCNSKKRLHVHHIQKWSDTPHMRYAVGNCITLCRQHHDFVTGQEEHYILFLYKLL